MIPPHRGAPAPHLPHTRHEQVSQVLAAMESRSAGHAILFMGDTNLRPSDPEDLPELERYEASGLRDACTELACEEPDHIDRFYLRDGDDLVLTAVDWQREEGFVDEQGNDLSDHPALSLLLGWTR